LPSLYQSSVCGNSGASGRRKISRARLEVSASWLCRGVEDWHHRDRILFGVERRSPTPDSFKSRERMSIPIGARLGFHEIIARPGALTAYPAEVNCEPAKAGGSVAEAGRECCCRDDRGGTSERLFCGEFSSLHLPSLKRRKCRKLLFSMHLDDHLRRRCSLFSIDRQLPELDVAGSIPVSRFIFINLQLLPDCSSLQTE
jgi:hypothetical protein